MYYVRLPRSSTYFMFLAALFLLLLHSSSAQDQPTVTIDPWRLTLEVGHDSELSCSVTPEMLNASFIWLDPNMQTITTTNLTGVADDSAGVLTIQAAQLDLTGTYTCLVADNNTSLNATVDVKIYVMPDYTKPGIIILIIDVVLLVIFLACVIYSMISEKKRVDKYSRM